ncbi:MAG: FeoB-associated Cys-rich membrane protein [Prevotella sp.]|nr:FeoB-associated Cys-rich membrane protein [Prevotella sp.]
MEEIIVWLIVGACVGYAGWRLWRVLHPSKECDCGCNCGCSNCPLAEKCQKKV